MERDTGRQANAELWVSDFHLLEIPKEKMKGKERRK